jgi:hypothetical protein
MRSRLQNKHAKNIEIERKKMRIETVEKQNLGIEGST